MNRLLAGLAVAAMAAGALCAGERTRTHELIDQLRSRKLAERLAAEKELVQQGAEALPLLLRAIERYPDARVRARCASIVGRGGDRGVVPNLIVALMDTELVVRRAAVEALGRLGGNEARDTLIKLLTNKESVIRADAALALGGIREKVVVLALIRSLGDDEALVRASAAFVLGGQGDAGAISPLVDALADEDENVRAKAHLSLKRLTKQDFGFNPDAPQADRDAAMAKWRAWAKGSQPEP
jgi:HEAT repeat protein